VSEQRILEVEYGVNFASIFMDFSDKRLFMVDIFSAR